VCGEVHTLGTSRASYKCQLARSGAVDRFVCMLVCGGVFLGVRRHVLPLVLQQLQQQEVVLWLHLLCSVVEERDPLDNRLATLCGAPVDMAWSGCDVSGILMRVGCWSARTRKCVFCFTWRLLHHTL
jgi:hypothetical protein